MKGVAYTSGQHFCTLSILKKQAEKFGIEDSKNVTIEGTKEGILIKRKPITSGETNDRPRLENQSLSL
jgi:hypothetical protein